MTERRQKWRLDPAEVSSGSMASASGGRRLRRQSRALDLRAQRLTLRHKPTGIEVSGEIPEGHYSRQQMVELRRDLHARLFSALEQLVARHLRIPKR